MLKLDYSTTRKNLQKNNLLPEFYTTAGYQLFHQKYEWNCENPREHYMRLASTLAKWRDEKVKPDWWETDPYTKGKTWQEVFFNTLWEGLISPSTPMLANTGSPERGTGVSCAGGYLGNNLYDRHNSITEAAILTKHAHGTSYSIDDWPHEGAAIKRGGFSRGIMPIIRDFINCMEETTQSSRRGSLAYSLRPEHGDFDKVLKYLLEQPEGNHVGWLMTDEFLHNLHRKDKETIKKFNDILYTKMRTGKGYLTFIDKMNRHLAPAFKDKGLTAKASNLCVAPETLILTKNGYVEISSVVNTVQEIWNGLEWSLVQVVKTGTNQKLLKVVTNSGMDLECTHYHKFYVITSNKKIIEKRTNELQPGDKLIKSNFPIIEGKEELEFPYQDGFYSGPSNIVSIDNKFHVPDSKYSIKTRISWLAGIFDSVGVVKDNKNYHIQISNINKDFLHNIQLMLHTLGVNSKISYNESCIQVYNLDISQSGIITLLQLGFSPKILIIEKDFSFNKKASQYVKVESVIDENRISDTYCFTESKRGMGIFNGILTGQCQETNLIADEEYTFSCVILCYALSQYRKWPEHLVHIGQIMSDCNISEYLHSLENMSKQDQKALNKIYKFTKEFRALGSGVVGLHTLFQQERIIFGSLDSSYLNHEIFKRLDKDSLEATKWLAIVDGEPEGCKGYGIKNATRLMMPPTKSTAEIMRGDSEGIGLDTAMAFTKQSAAGELFRVNRVLLELMKEKGVYNDNNIFEIVKAKGSVQKVSWLDDHEKKVFKTAFEIDMKYVLRLASQRQKYIDQGQSLNLYLTSNDSEQYIGELHKMAYEDENILSLYYTYSMRGADGLVRDIEGCESCSG